MNFQAFGETHKGQLKFTEYANNKNRAVSLQSWSEKYQGWEPFATLSVNTGVILPKDQFVAKTYSENQGLVEQFIEMGYFERVGSGGVMVGYAGLQPILRIVMSREQLINQYVLLCGVLEREIVLSDDVSQEELRKLVDDAQERVDGLNEEWSKICKDVEDFVKELGP